MKAYLGSLVLVVTTLASGATYAGKPMMSETQMLPIYKQECGTCHMAYPPGFLSKPAWGRVMSSLSNHYGTDASLDDKQVKEIGLWLNQNAGTYKRVVNSSKEDRLTTTEWFIRKHKEIKPAVFQRAAIKSPANCAACHTTAAKGDFEEDNVRIPK